MDGTDDMEIAHCWCDSNRRDWFLPLAHVDKVEMRGLA